jgi:hypothetical protein
MREIGVALASTSLLFVFGGKPTWISSVEVPEASAGFFDSESSMVFKVDIEIELRESISLAGGGKDKDGLKELNL